MGRTAWTVAGGIVGAYFGYPQLGMAIGGIIGGVVDPGQITGPRIGETSAQTSQEGAPRPIIYGTAPVFGNVIACGVIVHQEVETEGEKGGGPVTSTDHVYRTYAIRICEGPIGGILRVWEDEKLVYDIRPGSLMAAQSQQWIYGCNLYLGDETQLPDVFLQILVSGIGETPAYRGTAYMVFVGRDLTDRRGSLPQYRFEVAAAVTGDEVIAPLVVHPWLQNSVDPRNPLNDHEYSYSGFAANSTSPEHFPVTSPDRTSLGTALADMATGWDTNGAVVMPPSFNGGTLIGNSADTETMFPAFGSVADEQEYMFLHYNEIVPTTFNAVGSLPLPPASIPERTSGTLWGAQSPRASVSYRDVTHTPAVQWQGPDRNFSTETYTSEFSDGLEVFYTYDGFVRLFRLPSPPAGFTRVTGTAKQLAGIEYRDGDLYQSGVAPILLPGDPDYDNATFWGDALNAAVTAGTVRSDAESPVVVSEYAIGSEVQSGQAQPLRLIVNDIHDRCGMPAGTYNTDELTDLVDGLVLAGDYTGADAINTLRAPYFFDKFEADKKIWYPKRGAAVVTTLTIDDLVEEPDESNRKQAIEYPKKLHLAYQHAASGYAAVKATYARSSPDARVVGEATTQVPVVFNEDVALQTVHKMFKVMYAEAEGEVTLSVPESFLWITPTDPVGLALRGTVKRMRIEKADHADGVLKWTLKYDRQSAYTSTLTGVPIPLPTVPPSTLTGSTVLAVLDVPARVDSEDDLSLLYAVTGGLPGWYGAMVQRSLDGGANYSNAASIGTASIMGSLVDALPAASEFYTDTTNVLRVQLYRDTQVLESLTAAQFLSEQGAFALEKADGSFEVMQYRDAVDEGDGLFRLTTLHRGLLNSGAAAHLVGAMFVMLDRATHVAAQSAWIGQDITHRAPSFEQSAELAAEQTETFVGRSQLEWPVAYLTLARSGANVITATWTPRHRFGSDDAPVASINFTGYRVTLDDGVLAPVTFDTTTAAFTYDASALGSPLTVSVSALNRITGAGPSTSGSV